MRDRGGEHTDSVENRSEDGGDFLNKGISGEEHGVLLGPLFDELLILVEVLERVEVDSVNSDALLLDDLKVLGISDEADIQLRSGDVRKSYGSSESLIFLGVVVLKTNLELNSFYELSLLSVFVLEDMSNAFSDLSLGQLCAHSCFLLQKYI